MNASTWNIVLFSLAYLFMMTSVQTGFFIQETVVESINAEYKESWDGYEWNAYNSMGLTYIIFGISCWFAPSIIASLGPKLSMVISASTFCLGFTVFIHPLKYGLNVAPILMGLACSVLWTAQGNYLTIMSTEKTLARDNGILWIFTMSSMILGNLIVAYLFQGVEHIDRKLRFMTYSLLISCSFLGIILVYFLHGPEKAQVKEEPTEPIEALRKSFGLFKTKKILLACLPFFYSGLEVAFCTGVYNASIAFTKSFGINRRQYSGESGVLLGFGEVFGGLFFLFVAGKIYSGITTATTYLLSLLAFAAIFINLPIHASTFDTDEPALIQSSIELALLCSVILGFTDAIIQTQIYQFIAVNYKKDSAPPFAIFQCFQSTATAILYFYANYMGLHAHIYVLTIGASIGLSAFFAVERIANRERAKESELEVTKS